MIVFFFYLVSWVGSYKEKSGRVNGYGDGL